MEEKKGYISDLIQRLPLNFTRHFLLSLGAIIFIRMLSFISLPIFTNLLSVPEFGLWRVLFNTYNLVCAFMFLGINAPILRHYQRSRDNGLDREFQNTVFTSLSIHGLVILLILFFARKPLCSFLNIDPEYSHYFAWTGVAAYFFILFNAGLYFFRAQKRFWENAVFMILQQLVFLLLAVGALSKDLGVPGILGAMIIAFGVSCLYLLLRSGFWKTLLIRRDFLMPALVLGIPSAAMAIILWGNTYFDRYLIQKYLGSEQVALYGLPCNLVITLAQFFFMSMNMVLAPHIIKIWEKDRPLAEKKLRLTLRLYALTLAISLILLNILIRPLVLFLSNASYLRDINILPTFSIGVFSMGIYIVLGVYYLLHERLGLFLIINVIGCLVNMTINIIFLPRMGIIASALAASVSHSIIFVLTLGGIIYLSRNKPSLVKREEAVEAI